MTLRLAEATVDELFFYDKKNQVGFQVRQQNRGPGKIELQNFEWKLNPQNLDLSVSGRLLLSGSFENLQFAQGQNFTARFTNASLGNAKLYFEASLEPQKLDLRDLSYGFRGGDGKAVQNFNATLSEGNVGAIQLKGSSLKSASLFIEKKAGTLNPLPQFDLRGNLSLKTQGAHALNESFNMPGLQVSANLDAELQGDFHLYSTPEGRAPETIILEKLGEKPIGFSGNLVDALIDHDPHQTEQGKDLVNWKNNEVVHTYFRIKNSPLRIEDLERIEIALLNEKNDKYRIKRIKARGIRIDLEEGKGELWKRFPLFYYLRGFFPKIGTASKTVRDEKTGIPRNTLTPSFIHLDEFEMGEDQASSGLSTLIKNFKAHLYEVDGQKQFFELDLMGLKITSQGVEVLNPDEKWIRLLLRVSDPLRGGRIEFKSN